MMDEEFFGIGFIGMDDEEARDYMAQIENEITKMIRKMKKLGIAFITLVPPVEDKGPGVMFQ